MRLPDNIFWKTNTFGRTARAKNAIFPRHHVYHRVIPDWKKKLLTQNHTHPRDVTFIYHFTWTTFLRSTPPPPPSHSQTLRIIPPSVPRGIIVQLDISSTWNIWEIHFSCVRVFVVVELRFLNVSIVLFPQFSPLYWSSSFCLFAVVVFASIPVTKGTTIANHPSAIYPAKVNTRKLVGTSLCHLNGNFSKFTNHNLSYLRIKCIWDDRNYPFPDCRLFAIKRTTQDMAHRMPGALTAQ